MECGAAEVNDAPLSYQAFCGAAVCDGYNHGLVLVNDADFCAEGVEPAGGGQMIGIEGFSVGHRFAAQFFSVKAGDAGGGNLAGRLSLVERNLVVRWKMLFPLVRNDAARVALATDEKEAGERDPHCDSDPF